MLGNEAVIDALGFVSPAENKFDESKNHVFTRIKRKQITIHK